MKKMMDYLSSYNKSSSDFCITHLIRLSLINHSFSEFEVGLNYLLLDIRYRKYALHN